MSASFEWLNPPPGWSGDAQALECETGAETDFWRETFYGFTRDSGHAFLREVSGDFSLSARILGDYRELYDQAGLMLRIDARRWIKTGIEFTDDMMHFSVVVTNGVSDWSVIPLPGAAPADPVFVRLTRHEAAVRVQFHMGDEAWQLARLAPFGTQEARAGVMACSPQRAGFRARFADIRVDPPIARDLHGS